MKKLILLAVLGFAFLGSSACRPWWHKTVQERAGYISKKITSKLDLNETQEQKLNVMRDEVVKKLDANEKEMIQLSREFETLVRSEKIDPKKLKELKDRRSALQADIEAVMADKVVEFHGILNPDQRAKAADYLKKFRERRFGDKAALLLDVEVDLDLEQGVASR